MFPADWTVQPRWVAPRLRFDPPRWSVERRTGERAASPHAAGAVIRSITVVGGAENGRTGGVAGRGGPSRRHSWLKPAEAEGSRDRPQADGRTGQQRDASRHTDRRTGRSTARPMTARKSAPATDRVIVMRPSPNSTRNARWQRPEGACLVPTHRLPCVADFNGPAGRRDRAVSLGKPAQAGLGSGRPGRYKECDRPEEERKGTMESIELRDLDLARRYVLEGLAPAGRQARGGDSPFRPRMGDGGRLRRPPPAARSASSRTSGTSLSAPTPSTGRRIH